MVTNYTLNPRIHIPFNTVKEITQNAILLACWGECKSGPEYSHPFDRGEYVKQYGYDKIIGSTTGVGPFIDEPGLSGNAFWPAHAMSTSPQGKYFEVRGKPDRDAPEDGDNDEDEEFLEDDPGDDDEDEFEVEEGEFNDNGNGGGLFEEDEEDEDDDFSLEGEDEEDIEGDEGDLDVEEDEGLDEEDDDFNFDDEDEADEDDDS